ncbi:MAG TPA: hypothetical protein VM537_33765, partial [Anaerolineae bacterium]|nr:hypothetical protein [Anaerolineae bacterium]
FTYTMVSLSYVQQGIVRISAFIDACDVNATVLADSPLGGTSATYQWAEGAWSTYRSFPRTVEHYEQRCIYGGSTSFPQTIWGSITAAVDEDYDIFAEGAGDDGDAWTYILPGMNPIQWMRAKSYLMIGTTAAIGRLGTAEKPLTPTWTEYKTQARTGSAYIQPASALDAILFVERGGLKIREVKYTYETENFTAEDMTILAEHITDPGIVQIDFQNRPDPILWCVRSDGVMATFTYQPQHEVSAWAEQITGQDVNDWTSWDEFESVAIIPGGSTKANGDTRVDDEVWVVVNRPVDSNDVRYVEMFQALDWGDDPNYCWFVDCALNGDSGGGEALTLATEAVAGTYAFTYMSETAKIWGVPVGDYTMPGLDVAAANDVGGGIVGLPYTSHPFASGELVVIEGTTNYDGEHTLTAGTSTNEIQFTDSYNAETFDGTEQVVKLIEMTPAASGWAMARDSSGNFYYGHNWIDTTTITKLETDGTHNRTFFDWDTLTGSTCQAIDITSDSAYLYALTMGQIVKFDLSDGSMVWKSNVDSDHDMEIDASGNAYTGNNQIVAKLDATTGVATNLTEMGQTPYNNMIGGLNWDIHINDTQGIVIGGGYMYCGEDDPTRVPALYNLGVRTFNDAAGDTMLMGATYNTNNLTYTLSVGEGCVTSDDDYIYVLMAEAASSTIYKLEWNGSSLTTIDSWAGPTYGIGIYFDLYDNLVVVNIRVASGNKDILYFYDIDGSQLGYIDNVPGNMLGNWGSAIGGYSYAQGDVYFDGILGDATSTSEHEWEGQTHYSAGGISECVYADGRPIGNFTVDANGVLTLDDDYDVVIAGLNYYSIYESMPLVSGRQAGSTQMGKAQITEVAIDFYQSMGANLGATYDESTELTFSDDDFATAIDPWSGIKVATFPRGVTRDPVIYMWEWEPVPLCVRAIRATFNADY